MANRDLNRGGNPHQNYVNNPIQATESCVFRLNDKRSNTLNVGNTDLKVLYCWDPWSPQMFPWIVEQERGVEETTGGTKNTEHGVYRGTWALYQVCVCWRVLLKKERVVVWCSSESQLWSNANERTSPLEGVIELVFCLVFCLSISHTDGMVIYLHTHHTTHCLHNKFQSL